MKIRQRRLAAFSLLMGVLLSIAACSAYPVTDDYLLDNSGWNGCSRLRDVTIGTVERDLRRISEVHPKEALVIVVSPAKSFSRGEVDLLKQFLGRGGTILLADSFGGGNSLLEQLGVPARFAVAYVEDPLFYSKQPQFPLVYDVVRDDLTGGVEELLLGNPTALLIADKSAVKALAYTSPYSFLDRNRNGRKDAEEEQGPFAVLATVRMGEGILVLLSSPDMLTNSLLDEKHNKQLFLDIVNASGGLAEHFTLLFDEGHLGESFGTSLRQALRQIFSNLGTARIQIETRLTLALVAVCLVSIYVGLRDEPWEAAKSSLSLEDAEDVARKHPDWDREILEYLERNIARSKGRGFRE